VDPFPFVNRNVKSPPEIEAPLVNLNTTVRTRTNDTRFYSSPGEDTVFQTLPLQTTLLVEAAYSRMYKATLPDGRTGYIDMKSITNVSQALRDYRLPAELPLLDQPLSSAARKTMLAPGRLVGILGSFENYYLVSDGNGQSGWIPKDSNQ
jgi:peptidoglycan LD-endopeptidase LytH